MIHFKICELYYRRKQDILDIKINQTLKQCLNLKRRQNIMFRHLFVTYFMKLFQYTKYYYIAFGT